MAEFLKKRWILLILLLPDLAMSQSLQVMTYNIRFDNPEDGVNRWELRKENVLALLEKYQPDVLGVQEALHHQLTDILKARPDYAIAGVGRDDGREKGEYSAILYKKEHFRLLTEDTKWLTENTPDVPGTKGWDAALPRIFTVALLEHRQSGKELLFVNTHFDHVGRLARENSPRSITTYIRGFRAGAEIRTGSKETLPVVVMGDLNSAVSEPGYQLFLKPDKDLILRDSRPEGDLRGTYCTFRVGEPCRLIDYIFHSAEWRAVNYQIIPDHDGAHYPSDHLPVLVRLEVITR